MNCCARGKVGALRCFGSGWSVGGGGKVIAEQPAAPSLRPLPVILMQLTSQLKPPHCTITGEPAAPYSAYYATRRTLNTVTALT